jgi:aspartyl-tRNA(Asn)/glutamyl-tRNA(Gln) amidotransferase subunit B
LPAIQLTAAYIDSIKNQLPTLPHQLIQNYQTKYQLSAYDASQLCEEKSIADFFEQTIQYSSHYKMVANWILGPIKQLMNESQQSIQALGITAQQLAGLIELIETGKIGFSTAASKLLPAILHNTASPLELAESLNLLQVSDSNELEGWINAAIEAMPDKVKEYQKGKKGLIGLFVGEVKKRSKGKADPKIVTELLEQKLNA